LLLLLKYNFDIACQRQITITSSVSDPVFVGLSFPEQLFALTSVKLIDSCVAFYCPPTYH